MPLVRGGGGRGVVFSVYTARRGCDEGVAVVVVEVEVRRRCVVVLLLLVV